MGCVRVVDVGFVLFCFRGRLGFSLLLFFSLLSD